MIEAKQKGITDPKEMRSPMKTWNGNVYKQLK